MRDCFRPPLSFRRAHRFVLGLLLVCLSLLLAGCDESAPLSLLTLREVTPRDVEVGERIEISGAGFPRGRTARVVLRGTLHRPGAAPLPGFEARTEGVVVSESAIETTYDARLQSLFCGPGDSAVHTTFRGEVVVVFAAAVPGAPPASASLAGVVLDLRPPPGSATSISRMRAEGERLLDQSGIVVDRTTAAPNGLMIESVRAGSAAERAGLLAGDLLVSFDGVQVRTPADVVPPATARSARVGIRRGGDPTEQTELLAIEDYHAQATLAPIVLITLLAALAAMWMFAPTPRAARWLARRLRVRAGSRRPAGWSFVPLLAIPLTVAVPLAMRELVGAEPELVSIALFTLAASMALHGVTAEGGLAAAIRAAVAGTLPFVPAALAVGAAGVLTGAARITEASHVQGSAPWEFVALRGFSALALFSIASGALAMPQAETPVFGRAGRAARAGRHALLFTMATLLTIVFLGGWQSPFEGRGAGLAMVGAVLFVVKAAALGTLAEAARGALPVPSLVRRALLMTGAAVATIGLSLAATLESRLAIVDAHLVGWGLSALFVIVSVRTAWLVLGFTERQEPRLDPFA